MKTSINFKEAKADSEVHNFRKKSFDYIRKDLTPNNEYWHIQSIAERRKTIENYCKEKSGRKLQKNAMPIREAVVVTKPDTTMRELHDLSKNWRRNWESGFSKSPCIRTRGITTSKQRFGSRTTTRTW